MPGFADLDAYVVQPRTTDIALSLDGRRLVACVQSPDVDGTRLVSALWGIPLDGGPAMRLTNSAKSETAPAFRPDGAVLFTTNRPAPEVEDDDAALWALPVAGEARLVAQRPGGLRKPVVAGTGAMVVAGSRLIGSTDENDAERRADRAKRGVGAILHTGMPIRYWDHPLGLEQTRLLFDDGTGLRDLAPDATIELTGASYSISADGSTVATSWLLRGRNGQRRFAVALIDTATGARSLLESDEFRYSDPVIAPDGSTIALTRGECATFKRSLRDVLLLMPADGGEPIAADLGDLWPTEYAWLGDGSALVVSGDLHGRGAVALVDPATGRITRRLASDAGYTNLRVAPDGTAVYALRSAIDAPAAPVRLSTASTDQTPEFLPDPAPIPPLPGTLTELDVPLPDGGSVHAWLCRPASDEPAPVITWVHGGPFMSNHKWNWRANPWVAVANGWAVLLPDPALSTGYGQAAIDRAWPYLAEVVWTEVEAALDHVLALPGMDASRTALFGGSFGGYMTNWIAGHTERFGAIVTHAGLWALDQQHATTDFADFKSGVFGRLADQPEWYAANSPHNSLNRIRTPMLVVHGDRDYRVPVSEALRLWWDLVSTWDGEPEELPHRFLEFTNENHWVLTPGNVRIWYRTVLDFCAQHVLGRSGSTDEIIGETS